jgi:ketosteroid isomerase-like protein
MGVKSLAARVSVAKAVLEGFAARDQDRLLALFTPDAEFRTRVTVLDGPDFRGHDGVRAWLQAVEEQYDRYEVVDVEYQAGAGDTVLVCCRLRMRYKGDRYGMARIAHWVFHVDEDRGCVVSFTSFRDRGEALEAAGLPS